MKGLYSVEHFTHVSGIIRMSKKSVKEQKGIFKLFLVIFHVSYILAIFNSGVT